MTIARRFDQFGSEHPRANLFTGLMVGALAAASIAVAALSVTGDGGANQIASRAAVEPVTVVSEGSVGGGAVVSSPELGDMNAIGVDPYGGVVEPVATASRGTSTSGILVSGSDPGDTNAMGVDPFGGFVEPVVTASEGASASGIPARGSDLSDMNAIGVDPYGGVVETTPLREGP